MDRYTLSVTITTDAAPSTLLDAVQDFAAHLLEEIDGETTEAQTDEIAETACVSEA